MDATTIFYIMSGVMALVAAFVISWNVGCRAGRTEENLKIMSNLFDKTNNVCYEMKFKDLKRDVLFDRHEGLKRIGIMAYVPVGEYHAYAIVDGERFAFVRVRREGRQIMFNHWHGPDHVFKSTQEFTLDMWRTK